MISNFGRGHNGALCLFHICYNFASKKLMEYREDGPTSFRATDPDFDCHQGKIEKIQRTLPAEAV